MERTWRLYFETGDREIAISEILVKTPVPVISSSLKVRVGTSSSENNEMDSPSGVKNVLVIVLDEEDEEDESNEPLLEVLLLDEIATETSYLFTPHFPSPIKVRATLNS